MIDPLIILIISVSLALLFFMAATHKMGSKERFEAQLAAYELLPEAALRPVSRILPVVEMSVVFLVLIPYTRSLAALMVIVLLSVYALAMGINMLRGRADIDCGCGGQPQVLSVWLLLRNIVLIAGASLLLASVEQRAFVWPDAVLLVLMTAVLALVYQLVEQLVRNNSVFANRSSSNG